MAAIAGENEVVNSREFDYPRNAVFGAFMDPERLARWWGPKDFTNTFQEFDFRPGGQWRFVMHGPNGTDYPNQSEFAEIVPGERIVLNHLNTPEFQLTISFAETAGRTTLTWRQRFAHAAAFERARSFLIEANEQNFDRLNAVLAGSDMPWGQA